MVPFFKLKLYPTPIFSNPQTQFEKERSNQTGTPPLVHRHPPTTTLSSQITTLCRPSPSPGIAVFHHLLPPPSNRHPSHSRSG
ncbi:hypothetical protein Hanom_Chr07g00674691 [Helianthus anomalus]